MTTKTVKISESNYRAICEFAGDLQKSIGEPVSVDRAISMMISSGKLSDLAGSWSMSDKEADEFLKDIRKGWSKWKIESV